MKPMLIIFICVLTFNRFITAQSTTPLITANKYNLTNIPSPQNIAWDGNNFWVIDNFTFSLYRFSSDLGKIDTSFYIMTSDFRSLTYDGQNLVAVDNTNHQILKINKNKLNDIKVVKLPTKYFINGITWDGSNFYISYAAGWSSQIAKVIPGTDSISFVAFTEGFVTGLTFQNKIFYYCEQNLGLGKPSIVAVNPVNQITKTYSLPNEIMFPSGIEIVAGYFWVVDFGNRLLYKLKEDSTSTNVKSKILPNEEILNQNYPNPFNPQTMIEYKIKNPGYVSLKVYDVLGKEIATLVNEEKPAGTYKVEIDADRYNLSSGIYFYSIKAGNFSGVKKMILIK